MLGFEDGQGLLPGAECSLSVAGGKAGVAKRVWAELAL
jgi:hypothetical protein